MPVYTVHGLRTDATAVDRIVLVRDGFYFWAFAATSIWLVVHRLWWALLGYIALSIGLTAILSALGVSSSVKMTVLGLVSLLVGFEAATLWRWTLSRGKWRQLDLVVADDAESAERRFFDRFATGRRETGDRGPFQATRDYVGPSRPTMQRDIIGSFPMPGAPR